MHFQEIPGINDLINSEGPILALRENIDKQEIENERLYIMGRCCNDKFKIYAKINDTVLEMFFQGRLSVKELFLIRKDEDFIMENNFSLANEPIQSMVFCDEEFEEKVLNEINCGNSHYYTLPKGMILNNPFTLLEQVRSYFINSHGAMSCDRTNTSRQWILKNS